LPLSFPIINKVVDKPSPIIPDSLTTLTSIRPLSAGFPFSGLIIW